MKQRARTMLAISILGCVVVACQPAKPKATTTPTTRPESVIALKDVLQATRYLPGHPNVIETERRRQEVEAWMVAREGRAVRGRLIVRAVYPIREPLLVTGSCGAREFDPDVRAMFDQTEAAALAKVGRGWTVTLEGKLSMGSACWSNTIALTGCRLIEARPPTE